MSGLQTLIWKKIEKNNNDKFWPNNLIGASLIYVDDTKQYYLIGGNDKLIYNSNSIKDLNKSSQNIDKINVYIYDLQLENKWIKKETKGNSPKIRVFHKCIYFSPFIFLFGGIELNTKKENQKDDLYSLNIKTFEWKKYSLNNKIGNRTEFQWKKIESSLSFIYGGSTILNKNILYNDMWVFKYDKNSFLQNENKENLFIKINQKGKLPGNLKAFSMEYCDGNLYLFGGLDDKLNNNNNLYKFNLLNQKWEILLTKGNPPPERCYHEMSLINEDNLLIYGGIKGNLNKIQNIYNDVYIMNLKELYWINTIIGGVTPNPKYAFSLCCNYGCKVNYEEGSSYEIFIMGGYEENSNDSYLQIYTISEIDSKYDYFSSIKDINYKDESNKDNFLIQAEKNIDDYKEKIADLELNIRNKELGNEEIKKEINEVKKKIIKQNNSVNEQLLSLDDKIKEQEIQKNKIKENLENDIAITNLKRKLKDFMEQKSEKNIDFFSDTCEIHMSYFNIVSQILNNTQIELNNNMPYINLEGMKQKYIEKLGDLKNKLKKFNNQEDDILSELKKYNNIIDNNENN